jgi:hypothetical protein
MGKPHRAPVLVIAFVAVAIAVIVVTMVPVGAETPAAASRPVTVTNTPLPVTASGDAPVTVTGDVVASAAVSFDGFRDGFAIGEGGSDFVEFDPLYVSLIVVTGSEDDIVDLSFFYQSFAPRFTLSGGSHFLPLTQPIALDAVGIGCGLRVGRMQPGDRPARHGRGVVGPRRGRTAVFDSLVSSIPRRTRRVAPSVAMRDPRLAIAARRLRNQRLDGEPLDGVVDVVRWLGALQAQEYPVARWSIGQRARDLTEASVDLALAKGHIVRTHVMRDTWHLVAADDLRWLVEVTRPRIHARNATMHRRLGLEPSLLARTDALLAEALAAEGPMTRPQLAPFLLGHGVAVEGPSLAYVLMHAELELVVCSGPLSGKQHTYTLVDERVPPTPTRSREDGLAELARRFFASHGPATVKDFTWWASLTMADARLGLELGGEGLEPIDLGGRRYWSSPSVSTMPAKPTPRAHLLQGYDEYVIPYSESKDVLDVARVAGIVRAGRTMFTHAIVLDGQVIGHWRRRPTTKRVAIEAQLGRRLGRVEQQAVDDAVERYARFVGLPETWSA